MQVVFVLLLFFLTLGLSARTFSTGVRWLLVAGISGMIAVITFTSLGG